MRTEYISGSAAALVIGAVAVTLAYTFDPFPEQPVSDAVFARRVKDSIRDYRRIVIGRAMFGKCAAPNGLAVRRIETYHLTAMPEQIDASLVNRR